MLTATSPSAIRKSAQYADELKEKIASLRTMREDIRGIRQLFSSANEEFQLLSNIFNNIPAMLFLKDTQNRLLKVNDYFCQVTGLRREDVEKKALSEIATDQLGLVEHYALNDYDVIYKKQPKKGIIEKLFSNPSITLRTDKFPVIVDGKVIGIFGISVDISDQLNS